MAPGLDDAWINLGVAYRRNGELDRAEAAYRRALEVNPTALSAYSNLSSLLRLQGREEEAAELLELADSSKNRNPYTYLSLGDLAFKRGRLEEAQRYYEKALRRFRDNAEPYAALGLVALEDGDSKAARRYLKKATKLDPNDPRTNQLKELLGN
jgi:Flp pilus assembly protein TadD